jgi:hypothetical protein
MMAKPINASSFIRSPRNKTPSPTANGGMSKVTSKRLAAPARAKIAN